MAFNRASLEPLFGGANGMIWRYVTTDTLSSANVGNVMDTSATRTTGAQGTGSGYWNAASDLVRPFDVILAMNSGISIISGVANAASPHCSVWVVSAADTNGVSVVCATGNLAKQ